MHELKVTLRGVYPLIWRRLQVPSDMSLADLHRVLQVAFDWSDERRHRFTMAGRGIDESIEEEIDLSSCAPEKAKIEYEYDFGASWRHDIVVERIEARAKSAKGSRSELPRCVAGARAAPPEDCGGPWGYIGVLDALSDTRHPDHVDHLERVGVGWDADRFYVEALNQRFDERFAPRSAKKEKASVTTPPPPQSVERPTSSANTLNTPLTDEETELLSEILQVHSKLDVSALLGVLHAVVVAPGEVDASSWMEHVFPEGFGGRDVADAQDRLSILLRQYNEVATALADGRVIAPAADEVSECRSFAKGYLAGAALDPTWWNEPSLRVFLMHLAYLAKRFDLVPPRARMKLESEGDPDARICEMLGALVLGAYEELRPATDGADAADSRRTAR